MRAVRFAGIAKQYGNVSALLPIKLELAAGEFLTLLGPSGSGKTTLLNICAGYVVPSAGRMFIGDRDVTDLPARHRNMGMVFQNYALFPHMTVFENVAYGLRARQRARREIEQKVADALRLVRLEGFGSRAIGQLSGGQQQRVALARALVIEPDILLMDEPLGALDRQLRKDVQLEIRRLHLAQPRTTIYVTHDQEEALVMSDRIAVMRAGRIIQIGTGRDLYERPADTFVARFLGESNLLEGTVRSIDGDRGLLEVDGLPMLIEGTLSASFTVGDRASALIRPETVIPQSAGLTARVVERVYLGELVAARLRVARDHELWCRRPAGEFPDGEITEIGWDRTRVSILPEASQ